MKLLPCVIFSILLSLGTTSGMAAPQDSLQSREESHQNYQHRQENRRAAHERGEERMHKTLLERKSYNNEISLRTGAPISKHSMQKPQAVNHTQYPQLSAPSRYQQWIKVDNHFILINVMTNTVLKVVPE